MVDELKLLSARFFTDPDDGGDFLNVEEVYRLLKLQRDEIERLRKLLGECRVRLVNPCRFPDCGAPCGTCEACHDIQMTLEALRREQDD